MGKTLLVIFILVASVIKGLGQKDFNVYVFIAEECPICNYMGRPLSEIAGKFSQQADFHVVFPVKSSNYKTAQLFKQKYGLEAFETLLDKDQTLTRKLGARITPEVVITNAQEEIVYRGRINSAYYAPGKMKHNSIRNDLDEALSLLISGKNVSQPWPSAIGCYITMNATR